MSHLRLSCLTAFLCAFSAVFVSAYAETSVTEVLTTSPPALGAEYRDRYNRAYSEIASGELRQGSEILEPVLMFCLEKSMSGDARYVAFSDDDEFKTYQAAYTGDTPLVRLDSVCAEASMLFGFVLVAEGLPAEALVMLAYTNDLAPYFAVAYCEKGHVLIEMDEIDEARKAYEEALELSNEHEGQRYVKPAALRGLGFTLIELEQLDDAEHAYKESLKLEPDNQLAKCQLQYIENLRSGNPETAALPTDSCPP